MGHKRVGPGYASEQGLMVSQWGGACWGVGQGTPRGMDIWGRPSVTLWGRAQGKPRGMGLWGKPRVCLGVGHMGRPGVSLEVKKPWGRAYGVCLG